MTARRVILHVGAMKSGTSFVQSLLFTNRRQLLERGILLPGTRWGVQVRAVLSVISGRGTQWEDLVAEVNAHEGTSVISMEFLGPLRFRQAERVVASFEDAEVTVVITARDLNRSIAAMWQETVQNGRTWTWDSYLADVAAWRPAHRRGKEATWAGRTFWRQQDIVAIARTWARVAGPENVVLVTVPPPGAPRDLLWRRFASVLGTDPDGLKPAGSANESIGSASALALRRLNELLEADGISFSDGPRLRKAQLAKRVLARRKGDEPSLGLPVQPWVEGQARRQRNNLAQVGLSVVGDLEDLFPVEVPGIPVEEIDQEDVTEAALAALAWLLGERIRAEADPDLPARGAAARTSEDGDDAGTDPGEVDEDDDGDAGADDADDVDLDGDQDDLEDGELPDPQRRGR